MNKTKYLGKLGAFLAIAVLALGLATFAIGCSEDTGLNVSQVSRDPLAFAGEITINGTVAMFSEDDSNLFGVMDTEELLQCGRFDCGAWIMPTAYMGAQRPHITAGDNVVMTGEFVRMGDMVTFQASSMNVGNNIMNRLP